MVSPARGGYSGSLDARKKCFSWSLPGVDRIHSWHGPCRVQLVPGFWRALASGYCRPMGGATLG